MCVQEYFSHVGRGSQGHASRLLLLLRKYGWQWKLWRFNYKLCFPCVGGSSTCPDMSTKSITITVQFSSHGSERWAAGIRSGLVYLMPELPFFSLSWLFSSCSSFHLVIKLKLVKDFGMCMSIKCLALYSCTQSQYTHSGSLSSINGRSVVRLSWQTEALGLHAAIQKNISKLLNN